MEDLKLVLRDNLRRLLKLLPGESGVAQLMAKTGFKNGTAQRLLAAETSIGLDVLSQLARGFDLQPWQLLVQGLDPENLPALHQPSTRWPFRRIDHEAVASLTGTQAQSVEIGLLAAMAAAGAPVRKQRADAA